jgi:hypothetical protein
MPSNPPRGWPHEAAYRYLEGATGAEIAWEWLRRDPAYRRLASTGIGRAETCIGSMRAASPVEQARWGCLNIPSPDRTWAESPVLWSSSLDSSVLDVIAVPARGENEHAFDLRRWSRISTLLSSRDREHLLLQGPRQSIRIDVLSGTLDAGPVLLFHDLVGAADLEPAIAALRQFHRLCRTGEFLSESGPTLQQSRRLILALRTYDALAQGASIRDIGSMIHCDERVRADWPGSGDALKSQARRLIALAHHMVSGGYRRLLR